MDCETSLLDHRCGRRWLLAAAVGIVTLWLGGSRTDAHDKTPTPSPTPATRATASPIGSPAASPVASGPVFEAGMKGLKFWPPEIDIEVGTTVTWTNQDTVVHTATHRAAPADQLFGSPYLNPGDHYSFTFEKPGTYGVLCKPHPFMSQTVVVSDKK